MKSLLYVCCCLFGLLGCVGTDELDDPIANLLIEAGQTAFEVGESAQFQALAENGLGDAFAVAANWQSSNPDVASIDANGQIQTIAAGQTDIIASYQNQVSQPMRLSVVNSAADLAEIVVLGRTNTLAPNDTLQLRATGRTVSGNIIPDLSFTWNSSNSSVATVDAAGLVTALGSGQTIITATAEGIQSQGFVLTVSGGRSATFSGLNGYRVSGGVSLTANASGALELRLGDNFSAQSGPGLFVYLSNNRTNTQNGVELGALRKNNGADIYQVPNSVQINSFRYVIILCKPFNVPFGVADFGQ